MCGERGIVGVLVESSVMIWMTRVEDNTSIVHEERIISLSLDSENQGIKLETSWRPLFRDYCKLSEFLFWAACYLLCRDILDLQGLILKQ